MKPPWWELSGDASSDIVVFYSWNPSRSHAPLSEYDGIAIGGLSDRLSDLHRYKMRRGHLKDLDPSQLDHALAKGDPIQRTFDVLTLMAESGVPPVIQAMSQKPRGEFLAHLHSPEMEELRDKPWDYLTTARRERGLSYRTIHHIVWEARRHKMMHSVVVPGLTSEDNPEEAESQILTWISRLRALREAVGGKDADKYPVPSLRPWKTTCGHYYGWDLRNHGLLRRFSHNNPSKLHDIQVPGLRDTYGDLATSLLRIEQHLEL